MEKLILVTGANGYIAAHIVAQLLEKGYRVRGTVRSEQSADGVRKCHHVGKERLELVMVPDITVEGAFDEAVKGVDGVIHTASPFNFNIRHAENDLLIPAINGTEKLLSSVATHAPEVKRVVITSSFSAMMNLSKGPWPGHTYNEADWNNISYADVKDATAAELVAAYTASKTLAEKTAWKFVEDRKPSFNISAVCPPTVFGPAIHDFSFSSINISSWEINRLLTGELKEIPPNNAWAFADVRDVASAHVLALECREAANERFFITNGRYSYQQVCDILRNSQKLSDEDKAKVPVGNPGTGYPSQDVYEVDNSKSQRILGLQYRSLDECVVDAALKLIELRQTASA